MNEAGPVPASFALGSKAVCDWQSPRNEENTKAGWSQLLRGSHAKFIAVTSCGNARAGANFAHRNHTDEIATHLSISDG